VDGLWATKSEGVGLIDIVQDFQHAVLIHQTWPTLQTDGRADGRTHEWHALARPRFAV